MEAEFGEAPNRGFVGDVMVSFSSSSATAWIAVFVLFPLSVPKGLLFSPKGLEKGPDMI